MTKPNAKRKPRRKPAKKKKAAKKRGPGRPTKYTPETIKAILDAIEVGNYRVTAARIAGISEETFYKWMSTHPEFSESIKKAEAEGESFHVERIKDGPQQWQSSAWFLERKYPDRWGKRERRDSGDTGSIDRFVPQPDGSFKRIAEHESQIGQFDEPVDTPKT